MIKKPMIAVAVAFAFAVPVAQAQIQPTNPPAQNRAKDSQKFNKAAIQGNPAEIENGKLAHEVQSQSEGPTPKHHPGMSIYWTASGPVYFDQQLDAQSRLIFPYNDQQRFQWLTDRTSEQLDRQKGNSYSIRVK